MTAYEQFLEDLPRMGHLSTYDEINILKIIAYYKIKNGETVSNSLYRSLSGLGYTVEDISKYWYNECVLVVHNSKALDISKSLDECLKNNGYESLSTSKFPVDIYLSYQNPKGLKKSVKATKKNDQIVFWVEDALTPKVCDRIASIIPKLMGYELTADEMKLGSLLDSSHNKVSDKQNASRVFEELFELIGKNYINNKYKTMLIGYEDIIAKVHIENVKSHIEDLIRDIESREDALAGLYSEYANAKNDLLTYSNNAKESNNSFYNFILQRLEYITPLSVYGSEFAYRVNTNIEFYDTSLLKTIINQRGSYMDKSQGSDNEKKVKKILEKVFIDNIGSLVVYEDFLLKNLISLSPMLASRGDMLHYCPHPHLGFYRCLGENANEINKYARQSRWDMIIDQTIAATKNINFSDVTVMKNLISFLGNGYKTIKCFQDKDGEILTPEQFFNKYVSGE